MKTMTTIICLFVFTGFLGESYAQTKADTLYAFCYIFNVRKKIAYVSNIVNGEINSSVYHPANRKDLSDQWTKKTKTLVEDFFRWSFVEAGFYGEKVVDSYENMNRERTDVVAALTQAKYTIHYVNDFTFQKTKIADGK